jgi:hypothetical protein
MGPQVRFRAYVFFLKGQQGQALEIFSCYHIEKDRSFPGLAVFKDTDQGREELLRIQFTELEDWYVLCWQFDPLERDDPVLYVVLFK